MKPVIICGGIGSKMWPESRQKSPKHFLPLINGKSLFELNWDALREKFAAEEIFLQTNAVQAEIAKKLVPEIVEENIFIEPEMRNQGPATGFAAAQLIRRGFGDEPFMLIQADLIRTPNEKYLEMIEEADKIARSGNKYMTGGVKPPFAIMGVDYMIAGKTVSEGQVKIMEVDKFLWRDSKEKVEEYFKSGIALTHWNHSCMTPNNMMAMFKKYKPEWYQPLMNMVNGGDTAAEYSAMPKGPIEDVTQNVFNNHEALVIELPFEVVDFGTWESLDRYLTENNLYNQSKNSIEIDSKNNFVRMPSDKTVAIIGMENLVVIDTGDAILITTKDKTGRVGEVVEKLKADGKNELL
ncbi:MAG TPA: sugar phosphate nucleotidyltransferase [Patescibacteria group bacterium]